MKNATSGKETGMKVARISQRLGKSSTRRFVKMSRVPSGKPQRSTVNTRPMKKRPMKTPWMMMVTRFPCFLAWDSTPAIVSNRQISHLWIKYTEYPLTKSVSRKPTRARITSTRPAGQTEMQGRVALRVFVAGRLLKPNQRSLATRVPKLTLFSGPHCSLCDVSHVTHHPRSIRFSNTNSGRQSRSVKSQGRRGLPCAGAVLLC